MQGLLQKTMTLRQAMGTVFQSIYGAVVQMFANWAAAQIVHFARMLIMHKVNAAQKNAIDKAATASGIVKASALAGAQGTASFSARPAHRHGCTGVRCRDGGGVVSRTWPAHLPRRATTSLPA